MFNPQTSYDVIPGYIKLEDFHKYPEDYVVHPPYQRKNVWARGKKQALLDSLFRRYYVPKIVLREIKLAENYKKVEVIDGQQRIRVAQAFYEDDLTLPQSLEDLDKSLPGRKYSELSVNVRKFVDKTLQYDVDTVKGIDDPRNPEHQQTAAEIFWRLQQGETLNYMEVAHARLSSLPRNFVVKYADDISFDYDSYRPIENNPDTHEFFRTITRPNDRMQHLAILTRLLILEEQEGPSDISDTNVSQFIEKGHHPDGIGNYSYEDTAPARSALSNMRTFYHVFRNDVTDGYGMRELQAEYVIISLYLLLRHLRKYYVFAEQEEKLFRAFTISFDKRRRDRREDDSDIQVFTSYRQQSGREITIRDRVIRQLFFEYAGAEGVDILTKDERRRFSESERITIYRAVDGVCQECSKRGLPDDEARVPWSEYQSDHVVPHSKGGPTVIDNAQVLCRAHNLAKGASRPVD
ncbi:MAG: DUF262 domain-containing protein [Gemmatimonadota bacterium]|nr:DUF262 domain-containing protein [Gemmatimonadota bacterium]